MLLVVGRSVLSERTVNSDTNGNALYSASRPVILFLGMHSSSSSWSFGRNGFQTE